MPGLRPTVEAYGCVRESLLKRLAQASQEQEASDQASRRPLREAGKLGDRNAWRPKPSANGVERNRNARRKRSGSRPRGRLFFHHNRDHTATPAIYRNRGYTVILVYEQP